jgi:DNA replicative helicase MCM subunit Mcm2 (Cdc46/Mcm family)
MNDKGLLMIDEASGLDVMDIKELSATRSSGAVTINKIAKGEAKARTRLLWFSNARSGRNLEDFYWKGYGAFLEFIPIVEDQARYDIVISAAREDIDTLQGIKPTKDPPIELWRNLITYMWTLQKEYIKITDGAKARIAVCSIELEEQYGGGPLVIGVAIHEKLIRLGCAFAALRGSISDDILVVSEIDINFAVEFLKATYAKKSFDYKTFVNEHRKALRRKAENTDYIKIIIKEHPALQVLLASNTFRGSQVREVLGIDQTEASKLISSLLERGLLSIKGSGSYEPDKMLINIVKEMRGE